MDQKANATGFPRPGMTQITRPGKRSQKTMEIPSIAHGKTHYFYGHVQ